jgi:protein SCO1/2
MKDKRVLKIGAGLLGMLVLAVLAFEIWTEQQTLRGSEITPSPQAGEIVLQQADGVAFDLAAHQGRVVLIYFGYTNCPDFCPGTLAKFQQVYERLEGQAADVDFVFISADPQRDTPEVAASYAQYVNPAFIGLSGSEDVLRPIWDAYYVGQQIVPMEGSAIGYTVNHSTRVYVIDKLGRLRLTFPFEMKAEDMTHDVRLLLAE